MKKYILLSLLIFSALTSVLLGFDSDDAAKVQQAKLAGSMDSEVSEPMITEEPFDQMMLVLTHKRCVNCHPSDNSPRQGEDSHAHRFGVQRGEDNHGLPALTCGTCHQSENNEFSGVPGAPEWSLAPRKMAWQGLSRVEIARSMLNPENNGGRSLAEIVKHLTEHELVLWAWEPGVDAEGTPREKPPISKEAYIKAVKAWAESGALIPVE